MASDNARQAAYRPTLVYRLMLHFIMPVVLATWVRTSAEGMENIPKSGPYILVSNHVDNNDSYVIGRYVPGVVHFLARPAGMHSRFLGRFWRWMAAIPADREGLSRALALLKCGDAIGIYADGVITPRLIQAKGGVAVLAVRAGVPVIPVAIWGTEKIRLFPLPHGRRARVHVRYGAPRTFDRQAVRGRGLQQLADEIMLDVAAMLPPEYRGYYAAALEARLNGHSDEPARHQHSEEPRRQVNGAGPASGATAAEEIAAMHDKDIL